MGLFRALIVVAVSAFVLSLINDEKKLQAIPIIGTSIDKNVNTFLDIADVCISIGQFKKGYNWVNKGISQ